MIEQLLEQVAQRRFLVAKSGRLVREPGLLLLQVLADLGDDAEALAPFDTAHLIAMLFDPHSVWPGTAAVEGVEE